MFFAVKEKDEYAGFLCLKETGRQTVELAVMGVLRAYHRNGLEAPCFTRLKRPLRMKAMLSCKSRL